MSQFRDRLRRRLDNQYQREDFVREALAALAPGSSILDAGAGSQRYRPLCSHLVYRAQDFGGYSRDDKPMLGDESTDDYAYGVLDYTGDIWSIEEVDAHFDAILCTEVLEHIPYPIQAVNELARLLKPGGTMILTVPSNCLRHMDPYFFTTGLSDRWIERILPEAGLRVDRVETVGDYYSWMSVEIARTARVHSFWAKALLAPAFAYFIRKQATPESTSTLCMGYHVVATRTAS